MYSRPRLKKPCRRCDCYFAFVVIGAVYNSDEMKKKLHSPPELVLFLTLTQIVWLTIAFQTLSVLGAETRLILHAWLCAYLLTLEIASIVPSFSWALISSNVITVTARFTRIA